MSPNFSERDDDLQVDDRLEQDRPGLDERLAEGRGRGGLERLLRAIDRVVPAEEDLDLDVHDRVARDDPLLQLLADALLDGRDELVGDHAPLDRVDEVEPLAALARADAELDVGELAAAAGLLLVPVVRLGLARDRLEVGDVRDVGVDVELVAVLEPVLDHVQVQLAHPRDDQLVRLGVAAEGERRVLVGDLGQADGDPRLVLAGLRLDGAGDHRGRELDRVEDDVRRVAVAADGHGVGDVQVVELGDGDDVAGDRFLDLLLRLPLEPVEVAGLAASCRSGGSPASCRGPSCPSGCAGS